MHKTAAVFPFYFDETRKQLRKQLEYALKSK